MPYLHEMLAKQKSLAEGPTLGNLHPDARSQAIARAGIADAEAMRKRMEFLHSAASVDADEPKGNRCGCSWWLTKPCPALTCPWQGKRPVDAGVRGLDGSQP